MRTKILVFTVIALVLAQAVFAFNPDELNKVTFTNSTSRSIKAIFFSPGDSSEWGPDIMGSDKMLDARTSRSFNVHYPDATGKFDIMAIDDRDKALVLFNYEFKDGREEKIQFTAKNMTDTAPFQDFITLEIKNDTGYDIHYLFMSPTDSEMWGCDLLDAETILAKGDSISLMIPVEGAAVEYNVMAADEDYDVYKFDVKMDPRKNDTFKASIDMGDFVTK